MGVGVVRRDGDETDAAVGEVTLDRVQASFPRLDIRAVVARLDEHEHRRVRVVVEGVSAPVDAGQVERGGADPSVTVMRVQPPVPRGRGRARRDRPGRW